MKVHIILTMILLLSLSAHATTANNEHTISFDDKIILPFPSSSVFKKYSSPQPALSTGAIDISIPLYELNYRGVKIPFTLRYNTSGIKVFEDAFPNGLGWTLTPGLRVTRVIMGRPDEHYRRLSLQDAVSYDSLRQASFVVDNHHPKNIAFDYVDTQHDIFTAYLANGSITFLMEKNGDKYLPITTDATNISIEADSQLSYFDVRDEMGNHYHFGTVCECDSQNDENRTAWCLDYIETLEGERLNFNWFKAGHANEYEFGPSVLYDCFDGFHDTRRPYESSEIQGWMQQYSPNDMMAHLQNIEFPLGRITFEYNGHPQACPLISRMQIKDYRNNIVKKVDFEYENSYRLRLFLKSVDISGEGRYSFDYNEPGINYQNRYAQDWWGFYNGKDDNRSRIPALEMKTYVNSLAEIYGTGSYREVGEADRSVDTCAMQAGMLTAIHYPTGGTSQFEYEAHRWRYNPYHQFGQVRDSVFGEIVYGGGLRIKKITTSPNNYGSSTVTEYKYGENEDTYANCFYQPLPHTFVSPQYLTDVYEMDFEENGQSVPELFPYSFRLNSILPSSEYRKYRFNEPEIWYSQVTEYKGGGKTIYHFGNRCQPNDISPDWGGGVLNRLRTITSKGLVKTSEEVYSKQDNRYIRLFETAYNYSLIQGDHHLDYQDRDFVVKRKMGVTSNPMLNQPMAPDITSFVHCLYGQMGHYNRYYTIPYSPANCYEVKPYSIQFFSERLNDVTKTEFTPTGAIQTQRIYTYSPTKDVVLEETLKMNGETKETVSYSYPFCHQENLSAEQDSMMALLVSRNVIAVPFKTTTTRNGCSSSTTVEYADFYGKVLPSKEVFSRNGDSRILREHSYDDKGNCTSLNLSNGARKESYIWGYGKEYPVIAASGMNREELNSCLGDAAVSMVENLTAGYMLDEAVNASPDSCLISAYSVLPLVGISDFSDFNGVKRRYSYDSSRRLESISDHAGNTLSKYSYGIASKPTKLTIVADTVAVVGKAFAATAETDADSPSVEWTVAIGEDTVTTGGNCLNHVFDDAGIATIRCTVTDGMSREQTTVTRQVCVSPELIAFALDPASTEQSPYATISNYNLVRVSFEIIPMVAQGNVTVNMDGECYTFGNTDVNHTVVTITLLPGTHPFSISGTAGASGEVMVKITGVSGEHNEIYGSNSYLIFNRK